MPRTILSLLLISTLGFTGFQSTRKIYSRCVYLGGNRGVEKCMEEQGVYSSAFRAITPAETRSAVDRIIELVSLQQNFALVPCDGIANAEAYVDEDFNRYIFYDAQFMENLNLRANSDWASWGILAHEVGHHLNGDPRREATPAQSRGDELAADEFAGFILGRLDVELGQAQSFIDALKNAKSSSYPTKEERKAAVKTGYDRGKALRPQPLDPLSGKWHGSFTAQGSTLDLALKISLIDGEVSGTINTGYGTTEITEGTWSGNRLKLVGRTWDNRVVSFNATLKNGKLSGVFDASPRSKGTWEASKIN